MQKAVPRAEGILPELPRTVHLESGEFCKPRLPRRDNTSARRTYSILAVSFPRSIFQIDLSGDPQIFPRHIAGFFNAEHAEDGRSNIT